MNNTTPAWFLKKKNNTQYGPVALEELADWAQQCRIVAGNLASTDQQEWIAVENIPELAMDWLASRKDGKQYGPFPLSAIPELVKHQVLPPDATLTHRTTAETMTMQAALAKRGADQRHNEQTPDTHHKKEPATPRTRPSTPAPHALENPIPDTRDAIPTPTQPEHQQLTQEIQALKEQITNLLDAGQQREREIDELQDALTHARAHNTQAQDQDKQHDVDISELRQQIAFMKKNVAALNAQLIVARNVASQRARMLALAWIAVTIITATVIVMALGRGCQRNPTIPPPDPTTQHPSTATSEALPPITSNQQSPEGRATQTATPDDTQPQAIPTIQVQGISIVTQTPQQKTLRFDEGIFSRLDTLSPEGRQWLDALARQLPRNLAGWELIIQGQTDDIPMRDTSRFANNEALALARAQTVARYLTQRAGFPASAIKAQAGTTSPFPNDTPANRVRNRTVTITVQRLTTE